jgi:hypothetical protein
MKLKNILSECWTGYVQRGMKNKGGRQVPNCVPESVNEETASEIIKDLDKVKNDLLKKVDVLVAKKKKLYSNVDIESPMSADEKKLDKEIADLFSQINQLVLQKRSLKKESATKEKVYIDYLNKAKGFKQDRIKFDSYEAAVKWAKKNFDKFDRDMIKYESINEGRNVKSVQKDLDKVLDNIQSALSQYKSHKGTDGEKKHIENLKKLNTLKKKLESELDSAVSGLYRDAELKIED